MARGDLSLKNYKPFTCLMWTRNLGWAGNLKRSASSGLSFAVMVTRHSGSCNWLSYVFRAEWIGMTVTHIIKWAEVKSLAWFFNNLLNVTNILERIPLLMPSDALVFELFFCRRNLDLPEAGQADSSWASQQSPLSPTLLKLPLLSIVDLLIMPSDSDDQSYGTHRISHVFCQECSHDTNDDSTRTAIDRFNTFIFLYGFCW